MMPFVMPTNKNSRFAVVVALALVSTGALLVIEQDVCAAGAPKEASPKGAPKEAPPKEASPQKDAPKEDVPQKDQSPKASDKQPTKEPDQAQPPERENVFRQGAFDTAVLSGNLPKDWAPMDPAKVTLEQEGNDRFLRIVNDKPNVAVYALVRIPVKPEWKRLSLSTRMAGKNLKLGTGNIKKAGFSISYENAKKERIDGDGYTLFLKADTEWKPMGSALTLAPGTAFIALRVGLFSYTGELGVDDIIIHAED
jgi:hypothetical protein